MSGIEWLVLLAINNGSGLLFALLLSLGYWQSIRGLAKKPESTKNYREIRETFHDWKLKCLCLIFLGFMGSVYAFLCWTLAGWVIDLAKDIRKKEIGRIVPTEIGLIQEAVWRSGKAKRGHGLKRNGESPSQDADPEVSEDENSEYIKSILEKGGKSGTLP